MTQLGEMVAAVASTSRWKCPFRHDNPPHTKKNVLPPNEKNDAKALSRALDADSAHVANINIKFKVKNTIHSEEAQFTAHHLIPGNETWPKSQLHKWVDDNKGHIKADIGYNVNGRDNGVDLPGHSAAKSWSRQDYQARYAFACMEADSKRRQFHDRHPAYSDFVINVCNKIATRLEAALQPGKGCGKTNCGGATGKKYDPPYGLVERLAGVALRLESRLVGSWRSWKKPVMTSRFALMYRDKKLTQEQARGQLQTDQFLYP